VSGSRSRIRRRVGILDLKPTQGVDGVALVGSGKDPATLVRVGEEWLVVFDSR
jgi:hypothetical protein